VLTPKDILQIDATVLAGILILLSLIFANPAYFENVEKVTEEDPLIDRFPKNPIAWAYSIGVFFSFSACTAIFMNHQEAKEKQNKSDDWYRRYKFLSLGSMLAGFATFFVAFIKLGEIFY